MAPPASSPSPVTWRAKDGTVITWSDDEGLTIEGSSPWAKRLRDALVPAYEVHGGRVSISVVPEPGGRAWVSLDRPWCVDRWLWSRHPPWTGTPHFETDYVSNEAEAPPEALELIEERKANPDDDGFDENGELRIY